MLQSTLEKRDFVALTVASKLMDKLSFCYPLPTNTLKFESLC